MPGVNRITESSSTTDICEIEAPLAFRNKIEELLQDYQGMIITGNKVGAVNNVSMKIRLEKDMIVTRSPYRLAESERVAVRKIIKDLIANKIIRPSESPFASPIILARKKDGSFRMCRLR